MQKVPTIEPKIAKYVLITPWNLYSSSLTNDVLNEGQYVINIKVPNNAKIFEL
jgi:hypothetical protein